MCVNSNYQRPRARSLGRCTTPTKGQRKPTELGEQAGQGAAWDGSLQEAGGCCIRLTETVLRLQQKTLGSFFKAKVI